jgi:hypothetical protein
VKLLFLDESGNHALDRSDKEYPVFVLGGVIVDRDYYLSELEPRVRRLKRDLLGDDAIILHTRDIIRGKQGFEVLNDPRRRQEFYEAINVMMRDADYEVIACAIRKSGRLQRRDNDPEDVYLYSLHRVVELFCEAIGDFAADGMIFAEKRRPDLDYSLDQAWQRVATSGTSGVSAAIVRRRIVDLSLKDKRLNIAGLQLADLVVSPIGRRMLGKPLREDWRIVEGKLLRGPRGEKGHGLIVE